MRARRTIRKPTRWTPEEWAHVEAQARARGVPPLRFVREAALGGTAAGAARRPGDELVQQLGRILNNLRQLVRVAEADGADAAAALVEATAQVVEAALRSAPAPRARGAAAMLDALVPAGVALNALAHRANASEELPPDAELLDALEAVEAALRRPGA